MPQSTIAASSLYGHAHMTRPGFCGISPFFIVADVEVVRGDFTAPVTLRSLEAADAVFLVWTAAGDVASHAIEAISKRVGHIVLLTSPHQTPHPLFQQPNALATLRKVSNV